jgi:uncharacterized protein YvpB
LKHKISAFMFALGILITAVYAEAQKADISMNTKEKNNGVTAESKQEEQSQSDPAVSISTQTEDVQNENEVKSEKIVQNETQAPTGKVLINSVPHIQQMPQLARGCEVTSLAMLLQSAGVSIDKMTLAKEIMTVPFRDQNGVRGNPNDGFVGDIYSFSKSGYGVYHGPIVKLAEKYLPGRIVDLTGGDIDAVYDMVKKGSPVWVITNSRFAPLSESEFAVWSTKSGNVRITYREHSVVVVGYDDKHVYINDPLAGGSYTSVSRKSFEVAWVQMGKQAVSYQP